MIIKQCWEWAVFDQLLNAPLDRSVRIRRSAWRPSPCDYFKPSRALASASDFTQVAREKMPAAAGVISPHSAAGWPWPARRRPKGLPGKSNDFSLTQMASGNHALVEHGEDHELLLMDGVRRNPRINREGRFEFRQKRLRHRPDCPPRYRLRPAALWPVPGVT